MDNARFRLKNPLYVIVYALFVLLVIVPVAFTLGKAFFAGGTLFQNLQLLTAGTLLLLAKTCLSAVAVALLATVVGATLGATAIFLIAKTSLGDALLAKAGKSVQAMKAGFQENALSYMLVLRLVPLFPFFMVNLAPAFLGVSLRTYVIATFFGIMPATFVFSLAGSGLGKVFEQNESFSIASVLTPEMMGALVGLALLSLMPVFYKKWKKRGAS